MSERTKKPLIGGDPDQVSLNMFLGELAFMGQDDLVLNKYLEKSSIVQEPGDSATDVMSQKAVTDALGNLDLGTAAERDVGTSEGNVMEVGAFGLGKAIHIDDVDLKSKAWWDSLPEGLSYLFSVGHSNGPVSNALHLIITKENNDHGRILAQRHTNAGGATWTLGMSAGNFGDWDELLTTNNILTSTGNNNEFPMSQRAVTNALSTKANLSQPGTMGIGVGQTYINYASSRAVETNYTNTTGRPIFISIRCRALTGSPAYLFVDSKNVCQTAYIQDGGITSTLFAVVEPGSVYRTSDNLSLEAWYEMR